MGRFESKQETKPPEQFVPFRRWLAACLIFPMSLLLFGCTRPFKDPNSAGLIASTREKIFPKKDKGHDRLWRPDLAILAFAVADAFLRFAIARARRFCAAAAISPSASISAIRSASQPKAAFRSPHAHCCSTWARAWAAMNASHWAGVVVESR